jgi:molybdate transport system substrate-binding protein
MRFRLTRLVLAMLVVAGCGSSDGGSTASPPARRARVFAAASLTEAFTDLGGATFQFAGSTALVRQVQDGAPVDVIATADEASMRTLVDAGLVEQPTLFARNRLAIAVPPGNPAHVQGLADLAGAGVDVVLADPSVPAGKYAAEVLRRAGVTVRPRSLELDVKSALVKVTSGEADAAIVYVTDVRAAGDRAELVAISPAQNAEARYPVAVVKAGRRASARAFVTRLLGSPGRKALRARGFLPPE